MDAATFLTGTFGIILAILVPFACIVWLVFPFIAMNKLRGIREEVEKGNRYLANISIGSSLGIRSYPRPTVRVVPTARVVPSARAVPPKVVPLKISKGGKEFGLKDTTSIKVLLKKGELTLEDHYFNKELNQWVTLDRHPEFC